MLAAFLYANFTSHTFTMNCVSLFHMNFMEGKKKKHFVSFWLGRISFYFRRIVLLRLLRLHANEYTKKM